MKKDIEVLKKAIETKAIYSLVVCSRLLLLLTVIMFPFAISNTDSNYDAFYGFIPLFLSVIYCWWVHRLNIKMNGCYAPVPKNKMRFLNKNLSNNIKQIIFGEKDISELKICNLDLFKLTNNMINDSKNKEK